MIIRASTAHGGVLFEGELLPMLLQMVGALGVKQGDVLTFEAIPDGTGAICEERIRVPYLCGGCQWFGHEPLPSCSGFNLCPHCGGTL